MPYKLSEEQLDALRNPTREKAMKFWNYDLLGEPVTPDTPLAGLHKARMFWKGSTGEMMVESARWLMDHGFDTEME